MNRQKIYAATGMHRSMDICAVVLLIAILISGIASCVSADRYRADHGVPPCEITASMDSLFGAIFKSGEPGAIVTVMRGDSIVYNHAFGLARLDSVERVTDSTLFNVSSVSKLFTGVALMKLSDEGILSLDDSLSKFFPTFPARYFDNITVRHVLSHRSGLPDLRPTTQAAWERYIATHRSVFGFDSDYRRYGTEAEHIRSFENLDSVDFPPGTHYDRRDISYVLIAPLIENVTGMDFDEWMRLNIFEPAGMTETFYYRQGVRRPRMAHGYRPVEPGMAAVGARSADGRWEEFDYGEADYFLTRADRGVFTSSRDFMKFKRALKDGRIIRKELIDSMLKPEIATYEEYVHFGLGSAVQRKPGFTMRPYHVNNNGGFAAIECWWPECDIHYIVFSSRNGWDQYHVMCKVDSLLASNGWIR